MADYSFPTSGFSINVVGDNTGTDFSGNFETKLRLSHRDFIQKDNIRRSLLGDNPSAAHPDTMVRVEMLTHLSISIVDAPKFWKDASNGLDLYDDNVVMEIYNKVIEAQNTAIEDIKKKGETAKETLRKTVKKAPPAEDNNA